MCESVGLDINADTLNTLIKNNNKEHHNNNNNNKFKPEKADFSSKYQKDSKLKTFDVNDEKIRKFINGKTIVDQRNPFRNANCHGWYKEVEEKIQRPPKFPSPETREEQNKLNNCVRSPSNEFITTEEVLKQSKYVKTYIKNPDPYFKYDPTILARLKFEELKEIALKKPPHKRSSPDDRKFCKNIKYNATDAEIKPSLTFKKCTKLNYPDLADLKIKTGPDLNEDALNIAEVTENVKKFNERVKQLNLSLADDDFESSELDDDNKINQLKQSELPLKENMLKSNDISNSPPLAPTGERSFTNMIKSKEFQDYLKKRGLILLPKERLSVEKSDPPMKTTQRVTDSTQVKENKKSTVFRRLFLGNIFSSKPKNSSAPTPPLTKATYKATTPPPCEEMPLKATERTIWERQSFHGYPTSSHQYRTSAGEKPVGKSLTKPRRRILSRQLSDSKTPNSLTQESGTTKGQHLNNLEERPKLQLSKQLKNPKESVKENVDWAVYQTSNGISKERCQTVNKETVNIEEELNGTNYNVKNALLATSTPIKEDTCYAKSNKISQTSSKPKNTPQLEVFSDPKEWKKLKAIKEQTDRELYEQVRHHQHQQSIKPKLQDKAENIYGHLSVRNRPPLTPNLSGNFTRSSPKRHSISYIAHSNRNSCTNEKNDKTILKNNESSKAGIEKVSGASSNSIPTFSKESGKSENNQTPVILRRNPNNRRIGGLLTREDILQKLKEFCRKSQNSTPAKNDKVLMNEKENQPLSHIDLSPVSYISVETNQRSSFRNCTAPLVHQRIHNLQMPLKDGLVPNSSETFTEISESNSPIYAHVIKRDSIQSRQSELSTIHHFKPPVIATHYGEEIKPISLQQGTYQCSERIFTATTPLPQHIPIQIVNNFPLMDVYTQPSYYCYLMVKEPELIQEFIPQTNLMQPQLNNGQGAPLRLDNLNQQVHQMFQGPGAVQRLNHQFCTPRHNIKLG